MFHYKPLLALSLVLLLLGGAIALAKGNQTKTRTVSTPASSLIKPLELVAPTGEILEGVEACRLALDGSGKFNPKVFADLRWQKGASYPGEPRTEYYKLNLVNDVLILKTVDGCLTKAKLKDLFQLNAIRAKLIQNYKMKSFDEFENLSPEKKQGMLAAMGPKIRELTLFSKRFAIIIEPSEHSNENYVSLTFAPINRSSQK